MGFFGPNTEEINRVFHNVFQNINKINKRLDSIESQMLITCFNIWIFSDRHSNVGEELHLNKNCSAGLAAIYIAGQFFFMHDDRVGPQLGFSQLIKNKYIFSVSVNQKELFMDLKKITEEIPPGCLISPDGNILEPDGETLHSIMGQPDTETISWATFPIKDFIEASDAQKRHLNMEQNSHLNMEVFHLQEDEDSYKYPGTYRFKSKNFFVWIGKDLLPQNLNTHYQEAMEEYWKEKREHPELYQ